MKPPEIPDNEQARLRSLQELEILDTAPEPRFDALTAIAAHILNVPIVLISLVDSDRQWFKSRHGLAATETPRDVSFCGHVVASEAPLIVADTFADERFRDNPLVTGDPRIRFYAGIPLRTRETFIVGTLCAIDRVPRAITPEQLHMLELLAGQVAAHLEARRTTHMLLAQRGELTQTAERLRAVLATAVDGVILIDAMGSIQMFNPACQQLFGYTTGEVLGRNIKMLMPPPFQDEHDGYLANYRRTGAPKIIGIGREVRGLRKDGTTFPMDLSVGEARQKGESIFVGVIHDLTQYANAAQALRDREERYRSIVDTAVDAIITIDQTGIVESFNFAAEKLLGWRADEVRGKNVSMLMPAPYRENHDGYLRNYLQTGERKIIGIGREVSGRRKDGTTFPAELSVSEMTIDGRKMFTGILRDISERKRIDELKSQFVSMVSHELRTPLASIVGYVDLILDGDTGPISDDQRNFLKIVSNSALRLTELSSDLLDIDKLEAGRIDMERQPVDLAIVLLTVKHTFQVLATKKGLEMSVDAEPGINVVGDHNRLVQAFSNLLSNSIKYTRAGSVRVQARNENGRAVVKVVDSGIGMSQQTVSNLFTRFFRASDAYTRAAGGTGLGLSIAKAIIEKHGGAIAVESEEGRGSAFIVSFPSPAAESGPDGAGRA